MPAFLPHKTFLSILVLAAFFASEPGQSSAAEGPLSPQDSIKQMQLHPKCEIKLVAAEPEVIDPVAIRFDADGAMWVVEMRDYPNGPNEGEKPKSRIKRLYDKDGDGYFETATVFADNLLFANGLQPWDGGVIVTMAGEVAFLKDTNGDGVSDSKETWFRGFAEQNPQLRANHPTLGIDGWIYVANGLRGGTVECVHPKWKEGTKPVSIRGQDFRFHPKTGKFEAIAGNGQFGLTFDDFGNRFLCSNRNPCMHVVLENRHVKRNPNYPVARLVHDVSPAGPDSKIFPISNFWTTSTLHEGTFTAACGVKIFRGDALPDGFYGNSFTCDPTGNLVHRDVLKRDGATFNSVPGRAGVEFLASKDTWFRPVNLGNGPDGGLYVVDMYRAVIEHPQFMPAELKNRPDLRLGDDKGRIYRIVDKEHKSYRKLNSTRLAKLSDENLIPLLGDSNGWQRDTAFRRIYERGDKSIILQLQNFIATTNSSAGKVSTLWLLHSLLPEELKYHFGQVYFKSTHSEVRRNALKIVALDPEYPIQLHPRRNDGEPLRPRLITARLADESPAVRFQAALSLTGKWQEGAMEKLASHLIHDPSPWNMAAVLAAASGLEKQLLFEILQHENRLLKHTDIRFVRDITRIASRSMSDEEILRGAWLASKFLREHNRPDIFLHVIIGELLGNQRTETFIAKKSTDQNDSEDDNAKVFRLNIDKIVYSESFFRKTTNQSRRLILECLGLVDEELATARLLELLNDEKNKSLRKEIVASLSRFSDPKIDKVLLTELAVAKPVYQEILIDGFLANSARTKLLLTELEEGRLSVRDLSQTQLLRLRRSRDVDIKSRIGKLVADSTPADRKKVLDNYQRALTRKADAKAGRLIFKSQCSGCHRVDGIGKNVGPDISDYCRTKTTADVLTAVLDPNRAIDANYFAYAVIMKDGKVHNGLLRSETPTSVTLQQPKQDPLTLSRSEIETIEPSRVSLMPTGMERNINIKQMADLLAFIKNWRYLDGRVPIDVGSK